jgi:hypothetical protein
VTDVILRSSGAREAGNPVQDVRRQDPYACLARVERTIAQTDGGEQMYRELEGDTQRSHQHVRIMMVRYWVALLIHLRSCPTRAA